LTLTLPALALSQNGTMSVVGSPSGYTYTSDTPAVCTVDNATGKVAAYDVGTCTVTVAQSGFTSDTKSITIGNRTWASTSCAVPAPIAGDVITESADANNNNWGMPRDISGTTAPNNPLIRQRVPVTYTYNYAAQGAGTRLTTALTNSGIGNIIMPSNNTNGNNTTTVTGEYNAYVPLPVPSAGIPSLHTGVKTFYDLDASGNITTPNYWQPAMPAKAAFNDKTAGITEVYPANWAATIAAELSGKPLNTVSTPFEVTKRDTGGGVLGQYRFTKSGGTLNGASYIMNYYTVTGKLVSTTASKTLKAGTSTGTVTYNNMCQIEYTFTRLNANAAGDMGEMADPGANPASRGGKGVIADTAAACTGLCAIASNANNIRKGAVLGTGDFKGTFFTHSGVPRIMRTAFAADGMNDLNEHSISLIGGVQNNSGGGTTAQPNAPYYENKDRSGTNHSYTKFDTVDVVRDWIKLP
jgi:hypothetical protein